MQSGAFTCCMCHPDMGIELCYAGQQSLLPLFINRLVLLICNLQPR